MLRTLSLASIVAVVSALGAMWYFGRPGDALAQCSGSTVVGGEIGGPFELVNQSGQTVTDKEVITEPSLIYFGFTYCPDACPFDVSRNADAVDILTEQGLSVTPVFISIDPQRDTVEVIRDYAENMHEKMIALTGSEEQVAAASKAYKTYYQPQYDGTEDYVIDHSTFTYLVFPEHGFVEFFRRDVSAEQMAERTACYVENLGSV